VYSYSGCNKKIKGINLLTQTLKITSEANADRIPENLGDYQFVFIDSVSKAGMDITEIDRLHKSFPEVSFIFIYHTTKDGKFKGVNSHAHEVDVIIQVDKGVASSTGRFSAGGRLEM
jgi:hypothetical protein